MLQKLLARLFASKVERLERRNRKQLLKNIKALEPLLGFSVDDYHYYLKALTHRSFLDVMPDMEKSNERLEFLGDSVLNMVVADYLFQTYTQAEEGFLTKARSALVNRDRLYSTAEKLNLKNYLLFNQKYLGDTVEGLQTVLADAVEALIGAIYLDKGLRHTEKFILKWIVLPQDDNESYLVDTNYKGQLLEYSHSKKLTSPNYVVTNIEGPEHKREFTVAVYLDDELYGIGKGRSKKIAEQNASYDALQKINHNNSEDIS